MDCNALALFVNALEAWMQTLAASFKFSSALMHISMQFVTVFLESVTVGGTTAPIPCPPARDR